MIGSRSIIATNQSPDVGFDASVNPYRRDALERLDGAVASGAVLLKWLPSIQEIDPADPQQVDWAISTRFQAHRDLVILHDQPSSSLDPSANHVPGQKSRGSKMGIDSTIKARGAARDEFWRLVRWD